MIVDFDELTECPKCGGSDLFRRYEATAHDYGCTHPERMGPNCCKTEHHERRCRGCGFGWSERVKSAKEAQP